MAVLVTVAGLASGMTLLASPGHQARAEQIGRRLAAARDFFCGLLDVDLPVRLLVLDEAGWREHCPFPDYGMPFSQSPDTVYAAATDNDLWRAAMPDIATLPPPVAARLTEVYGQPDDVSARAFFDLLIVHELAHLFAHRGARRFPRRWLEELFCNLALHAFVEHQEPDQLAALETLPEVVAAIPVASLPHHTLAEWERLFERVGPMAFAWYQCRLHRAAATIYRAHGIDSVPAMWGFFADGSPAAGPHSAGTADAGASDADLALLLAQLASEVAAVLTNWPR